MTSLEQVGKNYKLESNDFKNDMEAKNYKITQGKSITNFTYDTITSIFNLEYPNVQKDNLIRNSHKMFPAILVDTKNNNLLNLLKRFNYNFYWIGNFTEL